jgi:hypothetical protein
MLGFYASSANDTIALWTRLWTRLFAEPCTQLITVGSDFIVSDLTLKTCFANVWSGMYIAGFSVSPVGERTALTDFD